MIDRVFVYPHFELSLFSTLSYVIDWIVYTIMLVLAIFWGTITTTKTTDFSVYDEALMHSFIPENETYAPIWYLLIQVLVLPLIVVIVCCFWFLRNKSKKVMLWDIHSAILGGFGCCSSQLLLVVMLKNIAAVPRDRKSVV